MRAVGLQVESEAPVSVVYRDLRTDDAFRMDRLVNDRMVVEIKTVERSLSDHEAQLLTYLRLAGKRLGLLLNFYSAVIKDGIVRRVL
jgi:GxxExxY protein